MRGMSVEAAVVVLARELCSATTQREKAPSMYDSCTGYSSVRSLASTLWQCAICCVLAREMLALVALPHSDASPSMCIRCISRANDASSASVHAASATATFGVAAVQGMAAAATVHSVPVVTRHSEAASAGARRWRPTEVMKAMGQQLTSAGRCCCCICICVRM